MTVLNERQAFYLFYLTAEEPARCAKASTSGAAATCFAHQHAGLAAMLAVVAIDDFCGAEAERKLGDLGWVSERALWHEHVIERGFHRAPVLPARFGTLFSSLPALERFIEANRKTIAGFLDAVRGQEEWGVKALLERPVARRWLRARIGGGPQDVAQPSSPGVRYLQERRAEAAAERELQSWLAENCEAVARSLDEHATRRRQRPRLESAAAGDLREVLLNLAALVPQERRERLFEHIGRINVERAQQGLNFVLSGPWPPYSFCPPLETPA